MNPDVKAKWLIALRSGKYAQGHGYLAIEHPEGALKHCCLGVLCEIAASEGVTQAGRIGGYLYFDHVATNPPRVVMAWAGINDCAVDSLVCLNDAEEAPFSEIADYIEANL